MNEQIYKRNDENLNLRLTAKRLYVLNGLTAKAIHQKLGVTEKTIGTWIKKYKWKEDIEKRLSIKDEEIIIGDFRDYLIKTNPDLSKAIEESITYYILLKKSS